MPSRSHARSTPASTRSRAAARAPRRTHRGRGTASSRNSAAKRGGRSKGFAGSDGIVASFSESDWRPAGELAAMPTAGATKPSKNANPGPAITGQGRPARVAPKTFEVSPAQLDELLLQALETELGGIQVYETAIRCARDDGLRHEWTKYLDQTRNHERILTEVFQQRGLDVALDSPGRRIVRQLGKGLVQAMETALQEGSPQDAQLVACECVVLAETKDHANWELISACGKALGSDGADLRQASDDVEDEEDEHLYHTMGWCRELWLQSLGLPAALPPPEERKKVKTAIGAAKAKAARKKMTKPKTA